MFRNIVLATAVVLALAITVVVLVALTKPDEFQVQRTATLDAPVESVFGLVNDFTRWPDWSPWEDLDPDMRREFSGAGEGVGAVYAWDGNRDAGVGRMEIVESRRPTHVRIQLDFERPMSSNNITTFDFAPEGERTRVVWSMQGPNPFPFKVMQVFMDMDTLVGRDFERGLAQLEAAAAREPRPAPPEAPAQVAPDEAMPADGEPEA